LARGIQCFAEDLGLHGLASKKVFELTDTVLELADAAEGDDLVVCPDRLVPILGCAPPPLEQQAWGDTRKPGDGGDRPAELLLEDCWANRPGPKLRRPWDPQRAITRFRAFSNYQANAAKL
jgi:hypothetical protein